MAMADYYLCDVCGGKAFYDANISDQRYTGRFDPDEFDPDWGVVEMKVLCPDCAKTHCVEVRKRDEAPAPAPWQATHQHYKGGLYRVIATGRIEADLTPVTIYDNEEGDVWVRPDYDFHAKAPDGVTDRFTAIGSDEVVNTEPSERT